MMAENRIPCHITGLYIFAVINLCALLNISLVSADIFVIDEGKNHTIIDTIDDKQASFGPDFPADGLIGRLIYVQANNACTPVSKPPPLKPKDLPWFALIPRGSCYFDQKVFFVQSAGFMAAIVHNSQGDDTIISMPGEPSYKDQIHIPSVFVGYSDGIDLAQKYTFNQSHLGIVIKIKEEEDFYNLGAYFIPFVIVVSITFLGIIIFSLVKCAQHFRRERRNKLSKKALKNIPTRKYKKGDHYDVCAICLDEYEEGEKLRVLPCDHTYHCKCIDPWLTERRKTCPQCKRRVVPKQSPESDSDDEEAERDAAGETTPLLGSSSAGPAISSRSGSLGRTRASTFERSGLPAEVQPEVVVISGVQLSSDDENFLEDGSTTHDVEGAVGGVAVINTQVAKKNPLNSEVEDRSGTSADVEAALETDSLLSPGSGRKPGTLAPLDGSINAAFTSSSSTSGEEEGAPPRRKKKSRKPRNDVV